MPVRKIPPNHRHVTGFYATAKSVCGSLATESPLEFDFATLFDFDSRVCMMESQPVSVRWLDEQGCHRRYTPDFLVHFNDRQAKSWLVEVKDAATLRRDWRSLRPRFKAAMAHAHSRGWLFHIYTDEHIRTPLLTNARFLLPYLQPGRDTDYQRREILARALREMRQATVDQLLAVCCADAQNRATFLPHLWEMIALRDIHCDLLRPLTRQSPLWLPRP